MRSYRIGQRWDHSCFGHVARMRAFLRECEAFVTAIGRTKVFEMPSQLKLAG
jgi:hypothetical protein